MPYANPEDIKAYYQRNKTKISQRANARMKQHRAEDPAYNEHRRVSGLIASANSRRKRLFGLTSEEYKAKLATQNNLCGLCHEPFDDSVRGELAPVLDHSHSTQIPRDFIHNGCNRGLGCFGDNEKLLELALEYLRKHSCLIVSSTSPSWQSAEVAVRSKIKCLPTEVSDERITELSTRR